jgi:hypothetical protein
MKITRNVITDLLPVYLSGEASPDTKALIDEFLRTDPEFSGHVEEHKREFNAQHQLLSVYAGPSQDHELQTLLRTRSLMERQKWALGFALMLTAFPFSFVFSGGHLTFMIVRDQPMLALAAWVGAAVLWIQYLIARRGLRVTGLLGPEQRKEIR